MGTDTLKSWPAYETIADRAGVSRDLVIAAVKRLKASKAFTVETERVKAKNNSNTYTFPRYEGKFERVPSSFFRIADLSYSQKAMLLCIRQFFNNGYLTTLEKSKEMAKALGLSYKQVHSQMKGLLQNGYVIEVKLLKTKMKYYKLSDKVSWFAPDSVAKPTPVERVRLIL